MLTSRGNECCEGRKETDRERESDIYGKGHNRYGESVAARQRRNKTTLLRERQRVREKQTKREREKERETEREREREKSQPVQNQRQPTRVER